MFSNDLLGGPTKSAEAVPRIESLRVENYRALRNVELKNITPLTVFLGPNGSGKSTVFDVFAFLSECFAVGLRKAWDHRGRFKELRTRGSDGPIVFEIKYRENPESDPKSPLITYHLAIDERTKGPYVAEEWIRWTRKSGKAGRPFKFLDFKNGRGSVVAGEMPDDEAQRAEEELDSPEMLAVNTLGQFTKHPRVSALRRFITGWYLSYVTADSTRTVPVAGPQDRLSVTGDNLPNVIQHLEEQDEKRLNFVFDRLRDRVPLLEKVHAEPMADGRLLLQLKDGPFEQPIQGRFISDGTLKMLAYLTILYDPSPPQLIGIEEPENHLHPKLLPGLADECRYVSQFTQLMITTHSPYFVDGISPNELWILYRDKDGYTRARRAASIRGVPQFIAEGAHLGQLWLENQFDVGNPLENGGCPGPRSQSLGSARR
jgi:predicted ATPase